MNWKHIRLIFEREVKDQLRDRRTMFTIFILPLLLYPLMGIVMFEVAQIPKRNEVKIGVIGAENIPPNVQLVNKLDRGVLWKNLILDEPLRRALAESQRQPDQPDKPSMKQKGDSKTIEDALRQHDIDLLVHVPPEFVEETWKAPIHVVSNQRWERSMLAATVFQNSIERAHQDWVKSTLVDKGVGDAILASPKIDSVDAARPESKRAVIWSKILPFIMLVWALTGAFYPAVDLCAGEKERGTLETLLSSPVNRREIVWGKLFTIFCFSLGTALLNLGSMYATATFVMARFRGGLGDGIGLAVGPIPLTSLVWLILLVIPLSAMFSSLALAVASLAGSTKEGQYYLMPLMLVGMPLVMLPMLPGMELAPGTSIIPVTGAILLSRSLMDGEYVHAVLHLPTVITVTVLCTLLATRWAVRQFESESVLFKDSSRISVSNWLRNAWRHRENTPTVSESVLCGLLILVTLFFGRLSITSQELNWEGVVKSTLLVQLGLMLGPTLIMATMLTRSYVQSFRMHLCSWREIAVCILLAIALHPTYTVLANFISQEYQLSAETMEVMKSFDGLLASAPILAVIAILALLPALCEEIVFRGFIFSGLLRNRGQIRAILVTSLLFGLSHGVLQQTLIATLMGMVLGWIAYQTGSVFTTIAFHFVHNAVSMTLATNSSRGESIPQSLSWAITLHDGRWSYTDLWSTLSVGVSIALFGWLLTQSNPVRNNRKRILKDPQGSLSI